MLDYFRSRDKCAALMMPFCFGFGSFSHIIHLTDMLVEPAYSRMGEF